MKIIRIKFKQIFIKKSLFVFFIWLLLIVFGVFGSFGNFCKLSYVFAASKEQISEGIENIISQRHPSEKPETWRAFGNEAVDVIIEKIEASNRSYTRLRLLGGLAHFSESEKAVQFLKNIAKKTDENLIRHASLESISISQGEKELEFLSTFISHPDPQTRAISAEALNKMKSENARKKIEEWAKTEKTNWVLAKVQGNLPTPQSLVKVSSNEVHYQWNGAYEGQIIFYRNSIIQTLNIQINILDKKLKLKASIGTQPEWAKWLGLNQKTENEYEFTTNEENNLSQRATFFRENLEVEINTALFPKELLGIQLKALAKSSQGKSSYAWVGLANQK